MNAHSSSLVTGWSLAPYVLMWSEEALKPLGWGFSPSILGLLGGEIQSVYSRSVGWRDSVYLF